MTSSRPATADGGVAILMHNFAGGGAERMFIRLANGFAARGVRVTIVAVNAQGVLTSEIAGGIDVVDLACARTFAAVEPLRRVLAERRPTAMLSGLVHINTLAALAVRRLAAPPRLVLSERNTPSRDVLHSGSAAVAGAHLLMPWIYRRADALVAVSEGVAGDLARMALLPRRRITVLPNPVITSDFAKRSEAELDVPWPEACERKVLLAVGRLHPQKDFATLLRAVARLPTAYACDVVILGEGEDQARLRALAAELGLADRLHLPGFSRTAPAAMRRADLFVLSSRYEGSPNVLVEAMAAGTPVVATDCRSGPREILKGGRLGPLVPVGDAAALARAITRALDDPVAAADLRARATDYALEHSIDSYLSVLSEPAGAVVSPGR